MKTLAEKVACPGCGVEFRPVAATHIYHSRYCEQQALHKALRGIKTGDVVLYKGERAEVKDRKGINVKLLVTVQPKQEGDRPYTFVTNTTARNIQRMPVAAVAAEA